MILKLGDKNIPVAEQHLRYNISNATGKELNIYSFDIKVIGKDNFNIFKKQIEDYKKNDLIEIAENGETKRVFNVINWSYRFSSEFNSEEEIYICKVEIIEIEKLYTRNIIIAGIASEVLNYSEEYDKYNEAIIITVTVRTTEEERTKRKENIRENEYFEVIRPDISDKIINMRYGKCIWSKHDGFMKIRMTLVEKAYDEKEDRKRPFFWPEMGNIQEILAKSVVYINELEKNIISSNLLSEDTIKLIKKNVDKNYKDIMRDFYLVKDVEKENS